MYVINEQTKIVNIWTDNDINRQRLASGKYGVVEYTGDVVAGYEGRLYAIGYAPIQPTQELEEFVRAERDAKLAACDWTQLSDAPISHDEQEAWRDYRQTLRDLPEQEGFPWSGGGADDEDCPWPSEPLTDEVADAA